MEKQEKLEEKEFYREKIIEMVKKIKSAEFLEKIYYFVKVFLEE